MSDRPGNQPTDGEDDDLAYLDAGLDDVPGERIDDADVGRETETTVIPPPAPGATAAEPSRTIVVTPPPARDTSWYWPLVNLVGLLVVIGINYLANAWEFNGQTTGDVVNKDPVPFQPAGWVFAIWGVIYVLLLVFVIYGLLPAGRHNARLQRISPLFLIANIANVVWIFLWHWEQFLGSLVAIVVLLVALLAIYIVLRLTNPLRRHGTARKPGLLTRLVLWVPFSVYLGWVMVAALANLMVWHDREGRDGGPFSYETWAVLFMIAAALVALLFVVTAKDVVIPLVHAVAFAGIADHNWGDSTLVSVAAVVLAVVSVGLAGLASLLSFEADSGSGPFGRRGTSGTPPPMTPVD